MEAWYDALPKRSRIGLGTAHDPYRFNIRAIVSDPGLVCLVWALWSCARLVPAGKEDPFEDFRAVEKIVESGHRSGCRRQV